jgi:hypothetical protein
LILWLWRLAEEIALLGRLAERVAHGSGGGGLAEDRCRLMKRIMEENNNDWFGK